MKIAVAGAGLTGSYLYRLLVAGGHEVDLYDRPPQTKCGINPCAWGTSRGFAELVRAAGLDPATYALAASDHVVIDQVRVKADIFTFDKQRLIGDLRQGAKIRQDKPDFSKYDRIVDCTGVSRAFLPSVGDDVVLPCVQYRVRTEKPLENRIRLRAIGYSCASPFLPTNTMWAAAASSRTRERSSKSWAGPETARHRVRRSAGSGRSPHGAPLLAAVRRTYPRARGVGGGRGGGLRRPPGRGRHRSRHEERPASPRMWDEPVATRTPCSTNSVG